MRLLRICVPTLLGMLALICAACGEQTPPKTGDNLPALVDELQRVWADQDGSAREKLLREIGAAGKRRPEKSIPYLVERLRTERLNPGTHTLTIALDYSGAGLTRPERKKQAKADADTLLRRAQIQVPPNQLKMEYSGVDAEGVAHVAITVVGSRSDDPAEDPRVERLEQVLARPGTSEIVPLIDRPLEGAEPPSLWNGDAASYDAFVKKHQPELLAASEAGRTISTGDGETRLVVLRYEASDGKAATAMVLRSVSRQERFEGDDFSLRGSGVSGSDKLILLFNFDSSARARFDAWCALHKGRTAALLVDEQIVLSFPVPENALQMQAVVVGTRSDKAARDRVQYILQATSPGSIDVPLTVTVRDETPRHMDTAIAQALVNVGLAADAEVAKVQAEGGLLGRRARWIRDKIRQEAAVAEESR